MSKIGRRQPDTLAIIELEQCRKHLKILLNLFLLPNCIIENMVPDFYLEFSNVIQVVMDYFFGLVFSPLSMNKPYAYILPIAHFLY